MPEDDRAVIKKPAFDAVAVFEVQHKKLTTIQNRHDEAYEEELEQRTKSALSRCCFYLLANQFIANPFEILELNYEIKLAGDILALVCKTRSLS